MHLVAGGLQARQQLLGPVQLVRIRACDVALRVRVVEWIPPLVTRPGIGRSRLERHHRNGHHERAEPEALPHVGRELVVRSSSIGAEVQHHC